MSTENNRNKRDKLTVGLLIGLLVPFFVFIIVYLSSGSDVNLQDYVITLWRINGLLPVLSISVLPNLFFFTLFNRLKYEFAMRGVMMATIAYALVMMVSKLLG
ncbi:MAG: hypothetical protein ACK5LR_11150 [Mangrovibacterium sp.]